MIKVEKRDFSGEAPETIRDAVRQLELAHKRSAEIVDGVRESVAEEFVDEIGEGEAAGAVIHDTDPIMGDAVRRAEAVLFAAGQALSAQEVAAALPPGADVARVLMTLRSEYASRGVNLVEVAGKWRFQSAADLSYLFVEERQVQKKLSQAALETLVIIAYGQPVTRAEIEAVRGVAVSKGVLDTLIEAGWIKTKGRRRTPGRPVTFGTTPAFLEHFGLESLDELPGKADLEAEGLLSNVMPEDFAIVEEAPDDDGKNDKESDAEESDSVFVADFLDDDAPQE